MWYCPALKSTASAHHTEAAAVTFLTMVFAGMVYEDFGARWEVQLDRWADLRTNNQHTENWWRYLQTAFKEDPIGRRYARALVLRLKFELGVAFSMVSAGLGILWLAVLGLSCSKALISELVCMIFIAWGMLEAKETHKVLSKVRAALLGTIRVVN